MSKNLRGRHCGLCDRPGGGCVYDRGGAYIYAHDACVLRIGGIDGLLRAIGGALGRFIRDISTREAATMRRVRTGSGGKMNVEDVRRVLEIKRKDPEVSAQAVALRMGVAPSTIRSIWRNERDSGGAGDAGKDS